MTFRDLLRWSACCDSIESGGIFLGDHAACIATKFPLDNRNKIGPASACMRFYSEKRYPSDIAWPIYMSKMSFRSIQLSIRVTNWNICSHSVAVRCEYYVVISVTRLEIELLVGNCYIPIRISHYYHFFPYAFSISVIFCHPPSSHLKSTQGMIWKEGHVHISSDIPSLCSVRRKTIKSRLCRISQSVNGLFVVPHVSECVSFGYDYKKDKLIVHWSYSFFFRRKLLEHKFLDIENNR